jgi:hypothetical protein
MYWTIANDNDMFPFGMSHVDDVYSRLISKKVDGLIT